MLKREKKLEQAHICIGGPGISQSHRLRYAAYVLNTALGGGMSSRLFQEVREKRGRVYSIYSFISSFIDSGYFGVYAGTNPEWIDEVLEVTVAELRKVERNGLEPAELARAKSQLQGNMLLGMESTDSRMNRLARNEIYFRRDVSLEELSIGNRGRHQRQRRRVGVLMVPARQARDGCARRPEGPQNHPRSLRPSRVGYSSNLVPLPPGEGVRG